MVCSARRDSTCSMACSLAPTRKGKPPPAPFALASTSGLTYEKAHEAETPDYCACCPRGCRRADLEFRVAPADTRHANGQLHPGLQGLGCRESANSLGRTRACTENRVQEQRPQSI